MNTKLRQLIRESINEYIKAIDEAGHEAGIKARMEATQEAINKRKKMTELAGLDEDVQKMIDERKVKEVNSEVKALEKSLAKLQKQFDKLKSKGNNKSEEVEEEKEIVDEVEMDVDLNENDPENGPQLEETYDEEMNESFLHMQKLAGVISETEYNEKVEEARFKKGTDIGKKGPGFKKIEKAAEKEYGSEEAGKRVAGAILKKVLKKKPKELKEEVLALFEEKASIPKGWKSMSIDPEPDPEEDMTVESYGAPMEGWDKEHYDYVNIMKTPENKYYVSTYIAFGDMEDGDEQYDSLKQAQTKAIEIMNDIKSEW